MTIKEFAKLKGLTIQAIYAQIREKRGYGPSWERKHGKFFIVAKKAK